MSILNTDKNKSINSNFQLQKQKKNNFLRSESTSYRSRFHFVKQKMAYSLEYIKKVSLFFKYL